MDLPDILDPVYCLVDQRFADKAACLGDLAKRAGAALRLEPAPILEGLRHREALGSTGLGNGIAMPHARLDTITRPFALVTRLREAIAFESVDDRPVDVICLALLPVAKGSEQLNVLACIARRLRDAGVLSAIRKARDPKTLHALLTAR